MSLLSLLFGGRALDSNKYKALNKKDFKEAIEQKKVQLVDVRTSREYKSGSISKAINIDFFQVGIFDELVLKLDKKEAVYLYCRSGSRSKKATRKLIGMGFEKVYDLKGGFLNWD